MTQETLLWIALVVVLLLAALLLLWNRQRKSREVETEISTGEAEAALAEAPSVETPSPFLSAPNGEPDDLRRIKGIGPKLATMLQELGVFHYSQIASWTPEQMAEVDSRLGNFSGRPERDQWQSQARLLASGDVKAYERAHGKLGPSA
ncbi:MAG: hypothetical protein WCZ66_10900 [Sphingomonadaceae bacterium]